MATRRYSLDLRNTTDDTRLEVKKEVGQGWLKSSFDQRLLDILDLPENSKGDVIIEVTVRDA